MNENQGRDGTGDYVDAGAALVWMMALLAVIYLLADFVGWVVR